MGLTPLMLWIACLLAVRNQRILTAYDARQADNARRAAAGLPPRTPQTPAEDDPRQRSPPRPDQARDRRRPRNRPDPPAPARPARAAEPDHRGTRQHTTAAMHQENENQLRPPRQHRAEMSEANVNMDADQNVKTSGWS